MKEYEHTKTVYTGGPEKTISDLIDGILGSQAAINQIAADYHCQPKWCPIILTGHDHYNISMLLSGMGRWTWDCPFCGETFTD